MEGARRRQVLWTCAASVAGGYLCFFFLVPVYPTVARELGVGPDLLGAIISSGQLVAAFLQIPAGVIADRIGRRPFLVAGLVATALGLVLRWMPGGIVTFAIAQLALGFWLPVIVASSSAAVVDAYARGGRAQAMGIIFASVAVGMMLGYVVMGLLAGIASWRIISLALAALPAALALLALRMPEPLRLAPEGTPGEQIRAALRFLATPAPAALLAVVALLVGVGNSSGYLLPFVNNAHGLGPQATGLLLLPYIAGTVVLSPLTGRLADRTGAVVPLLAWMALAAIAAGGYALLGPNPIWALPCYVLLGGAVGSCTALAAARMGELVGRRRDAGIGAALGGLRSAQSLGPALGPPLAGVIYVAGGFRPAFLALAAASALALAITAVLAWPSRQAAQAAIRT